MKRDLLPGEDRFIKLLHPLPPEFLAAGLTFDEREHDEDEGGLGPSVWYMFSNKTSGVSLGISYADDWIPYVSLYRNEYEGFSLDDYLKFHHRTKDLEMLHRRPQDIEAVITFIRKLLANEWLDIVTGKRWESVPVPDWRDG